MSKTFKAVLAVSAAALAVAGSAMAQAKDNNVNNTQSNWAKTRAVMNAGLQSVTEDVSLTAAAIGNSFSASLGGASKVNTTQSNTTAVTSDLNIRVADALGSMTATAAAIGNSASVTIDEAQGVDPAKLGSNINNNQSFRSNVVSTLNLSGGNITGNDGLGINATSAAIANSASVDVNGDVNFYNLQRFWGDARSNLNVNMHNVTGDSTFTSAAIANSASVNVTDGRQVSVNNTQFANYDPTAVTNLKLNDVVGDVSSTTAAISNTLSVTTLPASARLDVNTTQMNGAETNAFANIELGDVTGSVTATAAAIGNSVSINNLPVN